MMLEYSVSVAGVCRFHSVSYARALAVRDRLNRHGQMAGMSVSVVETIDDYYDEDCCDTSEHFCSCGDCPACQPPEEA